MTEPKKRRGRPLGSIDPNSRSARAARWVRETGGSFEMAGKVFGISRQAVDQAWQRDFPGVSPPWATAVRASQRQASADRRAQRLARREEKRQRWADAAARVTAGASIVDIAADLGVSYHTAWIRLRVMGVRSTASGRPRMDGRTDHAISLVAMGISKGEAAARARCALTGLDKTLRRRAGERVA
jgi:hypothetical protein